MSQELQTDVLTADEVAQMYKMHPKTVRRMAAAGGIPGKRIGTAWRFRKSQLDAWFDSDVPSSRHPRSEAKGAAK